MKAFTFFMLIMHLNQFVTAQTNWTVKDRKWQVEMLFPEGKSKALILSYDDGPVQDRKMVDLLNTYGLKGTFHINSGRLDTENAIGSKELKSLYIGHEVSVHSYNHPGLRKATDLDMFYEVGEDRRTLEQLSGNMVRGMAYPFGSYNEDRLKTLAGLGIEYARTVEDSYSFEIPKNFLLWSPTIHKFGKAGYMENNPDDDEREYALFDSLTNAFLNTDKVSLYYVWGHAWEYVDRWDHVEAFFQQVSKNEEIAYVTHIELIDYLNAYENLRVSADKSYFYNPSALDVYVKCSNYSDLKNPRIETVKIPAGSTYRLKD